MKWAFAIQRKIRVAILLAIMMLVIIMFSLMESYNINRISKSFNSIYEDRLIPAVDLFSIADQINDKRDHLFTFLFTDEISMDEMKTYLKAANIRLDSVLEKYESTYLVKEESGHLQNLKRNLQIYQRDELLLINAASGNKEVARSLYLKNTVQLYKELNKDLRQLTQVQTQVGKNLVIESVKTQASSTFITQLLLIITVILGVVIVILVITGKQFMLKQEKYQMN
ncbi:MCP four helix bundle domain-containing protein [Daejeonella oryzae]|uniref:MCP four helix bundle domain-containing protein n=1 Tax=Daejeonella oryzae TaxID=1122943 RepID=UPI00047CA6F1|nr:MCP four helix bundle domain-containing protein [Daejeonella oryzae]